MTTNELDNIFEATSSKINNFLFLFVIPLMLVTLYRFMNQIDNENYYENKNFFSNRIDKFVRLYSLIYYVLIFLSIYYDKTTVSLYILFAIIIYGLFNFSMINYYPWFTIIPFALNSFWSVYPDSKILLILNMLSIILCFYGCRQKPYSSTPQYTKLIFLNAGIFLLNLK